MHSLASLQNLLPLLVFLAVKRSIELDLEIWLKCYNVIMLSNSLWLAITYWEYNMKSIIVLYSIDISWWSTFRYGIISHMVLFIS